MELFSDSKFWVAVAFVIFVALVYKKVTQTVTKALDDRADNVRAQIDEAQRLREEAQAMLAQYQRQQRDAEKTAKELVENAKKQADALIKQAQVDAEAAAERQKQLAESRIAQMEQQAVAEVRSVAAEVAVQATRDLIEKSMDASKSSSLLQDSIDQLPSRIN
ncbi:MAG: F0F1 ATP synthase subunit B [Alphaproteobacteria bacterium]|nr:F0F1 ATP synthase subunit B [Alphaproteobacteria bacterium SS10]